MFVVDFESQVFVSPGYLRCSLPEEVKKEVQNTIEKIDRGEIQTDDYRYSLAGHLQKERTFLITEKLNYLLTSLCSEYDSTFHRNVDYFHHSFIEEYIKNGYDFDYVLRDIWINYGKKHDFNPVHRHSGVYSFVLWVKIPYNFEDEQKVYPFNRSGISGKFSFVHPEPCALGGVSVSIIDAVEWDLILFPSDLSHTVYPFFTSDEERISISGNLYYEPVKKENK